jgi:hypothetical protein
MYRFVGLLIVFFCSQVALAQAHQPSSRTPPTPPSQDTKIGLLLEPFFGYQNGGFKYNWGDTSNSGYLYGARLGADFNGLELGIEYMGAYASDDQAPAHHIYLSDFGLFAGYRFEDTAHVYGTYYFSQNVRASDSKNNDTYTGAYEIKLGIGVAVYDPVWINLEYGFGTFSEDNGGSLGYELRTHYAALVVSTPIVFSGHRQEHY